MHWLGAHEAQGLMEVTHEAIITIQIVILEKTECCESRQKEFKFNAPLMSQVFICFIRV